MNNNHQQSNQTSLGPCYELMYILKDNSCKVSSEKYWTRRSAELQGKRAFKRNENIIGIHVHYYEETFNDAQGKLTQLLALLQLSTWRVRRGSKSN